jgi:hypothetical protein
MVLLGLAPKEYRSRWLITLCRQLAAEYARRMLKSGWRPTGKVMSSFDKHGAQGKVVVRMAG